MIRSQGIRLSKNRECYTMLASDTEPGYRDNTKTQEPFGATSVRAFMVCQLL